MVTHKTLQALRLCNLPNACNNKGDLNCTGITQDWWSKYVWLRKDYKVLKAVWNLQWTIINTHTVCVKWQVVSLCNIRLKYGITNWFHGGKPFFKILTFPDLVEKLSAFYGIRSFITAFLGDLHFSVSWARLIHSTLSLSTYLRDFVKFALEQFMKARRESRGIALLLLEPRQSVGVGG
jgi:hypothetical protein